MLMVVSRSQRMQEIHDRQRRRQTINAQREFLEDQMQVFGEVSCVGETCVILSHGHCLFCFLRQESRHLVAVSKSKFTIPMESHVWFAAWSVQPNRGMSEAEKLMNGHILHEAHGRINFDAMINGASTS